MRILYTAPGTPVPGTHGGSVHALELCRALARRGHEVHLAARQGRGTADLDGVAFHPLRRMLPARLLEWTAALAVRRLAGRLAPQVIVERFYTFGGGGLWAARSLGVPAVLEVNSPARPYPGLRDRLDRLTVFRPVDRWRRRQLEWADAVYATSRRLVPPELQDSVRVVVNGVDVGRFRPGEPVPESGPLRCVFVSSFRAWHGAEHLVEAVEICCRRGLPLHVVCLGSGPRWRATRHMVRRAGLERVIDLVGSVPHRSVPAHLAAAHVGLAPFAPSLFRALELGWFWSPVKLFEYLAAGLPVVTADLPELRELLPTEVATFYRVGEPMALAEALMELEEDRDAVRRKGRAARRLAEERYTWDQQAADVEQVLEGVLVEGHGCRASAPAGSDPPPSAGSKETAGQETGS